MYRCSENSLRHGFTLIELLVVVSIIALLIGLLLPALGMAFQNVRDVTCKSNLRQYGTYWTLAMNDHNGTFPHMRGSGSPGWDNYLWDQVGDENLSLIQNGEQVRDWRVCPQSQAIFAEQSFLYLRWGYAPNHWWDNDTKEWNSLKPWGSIQRPSQYPMWGDTQFYPWGRPGLYRAQHYIPSATRGAPDWGVGLHHGNQDRANFVFADMSVSPITREDVEEGIHGKDDYPLFANYR